MTWRSRKKLKNSIGFKLILARKSQKPIKPWEKGRSYRKFAVLATEHIELGILLGQVPKKYNTTERVHLRKTDSISNSGS